MLTKTRVAEAAKLMDEARPDWYTRINFDTLQMSNPYKCIAGQSGLNSTMMNARVLKSTGGMGAPSPFGSSEKVVPYWRDEVAKRLAPPQEHVRLRDKVLLALSACLPF